MPTERIQTQIPSKREANGFGVFVLYEDTQIIGIILVYTVKK